MWINIISLFPAMFDALNLGVLGRARERGLLEISSINPREFANDIHRTVDDRPYGGGPGMVLMAEPLAKAINFAKNIAPGPAKVIYLSPQGTRLTQEKVLELSKTPSLILLCGRYEGIDERLMISEIDEEISIGDYVLSGGEFGAMVLIDAISRLLPGVLGHNESADQDSFSDGLLDCPHYTRPEIYEGMNVPPILLSGHHQAIAKWRKQQMLGRTWLKRPDLLNKKKLSKEEQVLLETFIKEYTRGDRHE